MMLDIKTEQSQCLPKISLHGSELFFGPLINVSIVPHQNLIMYIQAPVT
jgi:hypothetical protein